MKNTKNTNENKLNKLNKSVKTAALSVITAALLTESAFAAPASILTFQSIPTWEKNMRVFDKNGQVIYDPAKTTFTTADDPAPQVPSYIPAMKSAPADLGESVIIDCTLANEYQQQWFDNITSIKGYDNNNGSYREYDLDYQLLKAEGRIIIRSTRELEYAREHQLRIVSTSYDPVYTSIQIVEKEKPHLILSTPGTPKVGEDIPFTVRNFNYGLSNPIKKVELIRYEGFDAQGKPIQVEKRELRSVKDIEKDYEYGLIGDVFRIYHNAIDKPGIYKVIVIAEGFKGFTAMFEVAEAAERRGAANFERSMEIVDVVARATSGGGGGSIGGGNSGSGGGGGSLNTQGHILFDNDLLVNALILDEIDKSTTDSKKVAERWKNVTSWDAAFDETFNDRKSFDDYHQAVRNAKLHDGSYLTFEEYAKYAKNPDYKGTPQEVQKVLEDGRLGTAFRFRDIFGKKAPEATFVQKEYGKDVILAFNNGEDFVSNIKTLSLKEFSLTELKHTKEKNQLTINAKNLRRGTNTLQIDSEGYKLLVLKFDLQPQNQKVTLKVEDDLYAKEPVEILGATEDFKKHLKAIKVNGELLFEKSAVGGRDGLKDKFYEWKDLKLVLSAANFEEGSYTVSLTAEHYGEKKISFKVGPAIIRADKTALEKAIKAADEKSIALELYTEESRKAFEKARGEAKDVNSDKKATQLTVNKATRNLNEAMKGLKLKSSENKDYPSIDIKEYQGMIVVQIDPSDKNGESYLRDIKTVQINAKNAKIFASSDPSLSSYKGLYVLRDTDRRRIYIPKTKLSDVKTLLLKAAGFKDFVYSKTELNKEKLNEEIAKAEKITDLSKYTEETKENFTKALQKAKEVQQNVQATQEEVNDAADKLSEAIAALRKIEEEKLQLPTFKVTEKSGNIILTGTPEKEAKAFIQKIDHVLIDDQEISMNPMSGGVSAYKNGTKIIIQNKKLSAVTKEIRLKAPGYEDYVYSKEKAKKEKLDQAIQKAEEIKDFSEYTEQMEEDLTQALKNAKAVQKNDQATQPQVDEAVSELEKAIAALKKVDKSALNEAVQAAKEKISELGQYTDDSAEKFIQALDQAEEVLKDRNATEDKVAEVTAALTKAQSELEEKPATPAGKQPPKFNAVKRNGNIVLEVISWTEAEKTYMKAVEQVLFNGEELPINMVSSGVYAYRNGKTFTIYGKKPEEVKEIRLKAPGYEDYVFTKGQQTPPVQKKTLNEAIDKAKEITDLNEYSEQMEANFNEALTKAIEVQKDKQANQEQVNEAATNLQNAIDALKKVDKSDLEKAIREAEAKNSELEQYTEDSVATFNEALEKATTVFSDRNASEEQVQEATDALKNAQNDLTEKQTPPAPPQGNLPPQLDVRDDFEAVLLEGSMNDNTKNYIDAVKQIIVNDRNMTIGFMESAAKFNYSIRIRQSFSNIRSIRLVADGYEDFVYQK